MDWPIHYRKVLDYLSSIRKMSDSSFQKEFLMGTIPSVDRETICFYHNTQELLPIAIMNLKAFQKYGRKRACLYDCKYHGRYLERFNLITLRVTQKCCSYGVINQSHEMIESSPSKKSENDMDFD